MLTFRILLLSILFMSMIQSDPIHMDMQIRCDPSIKNWCAEFLVYEVDTIPYSHDHLLSQKFCSNQPGVHFKWTQQLGGDTSAHYEINYMLQHNCTIMGSFRCVNENENEVRVSVDGEQHVKFEVAAFNRGTYERCPFHVVADK
ncbi:hypothetical protein GCK72_022544 [Caenorhabditis remanei]|uniref:Uncharacterized protein n=1 Tax=Caenorhabditis remanei TaxID=31234 RepID=A0A6A5FU51_CAERE|nr:hypothetical protein GCK72_022544 [Caenorhabditis remanei]KAF1746092.1 hypothetical protein GCK72_022544 [Caenorhabditis remanei]